MVSRRTLLRQYVAVSDSQLVGPAAAERVNLVVLASQLGCSIEELERRGHQDERSREPGRIRRAAEALRRRPNVVIQLDARESLPLYQLVEQFQSQSVRCAWPPCENLVQRRGPHPGQPRKYCCQQHKRLVHRARMLANEPQMMKRSA